LAADRGNPHQGTANGPSSRALSALNSDAGQAWITRGIERAVHQLNVTNLVEQQVKGLDTDELEKWCSTTPAAISP